MWKKILSGTLSGLFLFSVAEAKSIRTPEGNFPRVQWAVVEATAGNLPKISEIGARVLASTTAKEAGTYALYGVVEKDNPDLMRLLEIYESNEAYRIHSASPAFQQYRAERFQFMKDLKILPVNAIALEQKDSGTGTVVYTHRYEISAVDLPKVQKLLADEAVRAVREDSGVMGYFVTAEQANPNILHTMEIFKDEKSYSAYTSSRSYKNLQKKISPAIQNLREIEYLPANITLTQKGSRL